MVDVRDYDQPVDVSGHDMGKCDRERKQVEELFDQHMVFDQHMDFHMDLFDM